MQPQLRFTKDKRGYENTYLVQPAGAARRGRSRTRILYWFRTPPGIRVGRGPLDEEAIRMLEAQNPDVPFDWTRILKGQPPAETRQAAVGEERERGRDKRRQRSPASRPPAEPESRAASPAPEPRRVEAERVVVEEPTSAAHARLGSEGLGRLRARYSEMLARIGERVADAERQAELKLVAERLNPDGWVTDTDVAAALEGYEATFAALRAELVPGRPAAPPAETAAEE